MKKGIIKMTFLLFLFLCSAKTYANNKDEALFKAAPDSLKSKVSKTEIHKAIKEGLWNKDKSAVAIYFLRPESSIIYIFIFNNDGKILPVDISTVENGNVGKVGYARKNEYDKFETKPVNWIERNDDLLQINMRTRVWKNGQRYTTYEKLLLNKEGRVFWR